MVRKPDRQNDRVWVKNIEDISTGVRYREIVQNAKYIGIFVMFTAKRLLWVLKQHERSRDEICFRVVFLQQHVISFLRNSANVLDTDEVVFLHNKAPCMKANTT